ncbi:MAG: hypothetical protein K9I85_15805 [Saprospiraceae bacterium]|nr:hypothetical protein [Saprospiraceae bacterium]
MKPTSNLLNRIANWKSLLIFLLLYLFFNGYVLKNSEAKINELAGDDVGVIDLTIGFDPQKTLDMVAAYGDTARAYYAQSEMTTDVAYPIIYAFLFGIILTLLYRNRSIARIHLLPFLTLLMDFAENINIITLLKSYPQQSYLIATLCEVFKLGKWLSFGLIILLVIYGLILLLINRTRTPARSV